MIVEGRDEWRDGDAVSYYHLIRERMDSIKSNVNKRQIETSTKPYGCHDMNIYVYIYVYTRWTNSPNKYSVSPEKSTTLPSTVG